MAIRGLIFDMDGTLVDSGLDFNAMRREMGLDRGLPLLEAIALLPPVDAARCWDILAAHEREGSERAALFPGVREFLQASSERGLARAVVTRNSRVATLSTLGRLGLEFAPIVCREDGPAKPDPAAIWQICAAWGLRPKQCVMIGDYHFDIQIGRRAGTRTVWFCPDGQSETWHDEAPADFVLSSFAEAAPFWAWLAQIDLGPSPGCC